MIVLSPTAAAWSGRLFRLFGACVLGLAAVSAAADDGALRAKHSELSDQLRNNSFQRAMHIDSGQQGDTLKGDVYAVLNHPFSRVSGKLKDPAQWCDILILPFNTKYCHAIESEGGPALLVRIGRKYDQPVEQAYRLDFAYRAVAATPDYFESRLTARNGPLGTRDYRITLSATPLEGGKTFMHLNYSYVYGTAGRLAMQGYLATVGADKVGFTITGKDGNGQSIYIGGVRGAIERNAMRYYLAIDAHLASFSVPPGQQLEKRIQTWFSGTERYPRQLREMDRTAYVAMKRGEHERQQALIQ